jgi:hypothetical protein
MKTYLLVEGNSDRALFQRLLPSGIQPETTIVAVGGRSNITSKARSLMVTKRRPLALVTDADAVENDAVEQRFQTLEELVRSATAGVPYKVVLAVPEIESWFFVVPNVLERLSGKSLSPEQRVLGGLRPREVLKQLFKDQGDVSIDQLANELTESEIKTLQETQPRKALIEFLTEQVNKEAEPHSA